MTMITKGREQIASAYRGASWNGSYIATGRWIFAHKGGDYRQSESECKPAERHDGMAPAHAVDEGLRDVRPQHGPRAAAGHNQGERETASAREPTRHGTGVG